MTTSINSFRDRIDSIDAAMVLSLEQRIATAREIAAFKEAQGIPIVDGGREEEILRKIVRRN